MIAAASVSAAAAAPWTNSVRAVGRGSTGASRPASACGAGTSARVSGNSTAAKRDHSAPCPHSSPAPRIATSRPTGTTAIASPNVSTCQKPWPGAGAWIGPTVAPSSVRASTASIAASARKTAAKATSNGTTSGVNDSESVDDHPATRTAKPSPASGTDASACTSRRALRVSGLARRNGTAGRTRALVIEVTMPR